MLQAAVHLLRCPSCGAALTIDGGRLRCAAGHSTDIARQGYVNLAGRQSAGLRADTTEMVAARDRFLSAGHYDAVQDAVAEAVLEGMDAPARATPAALLELGSGTGAYLTRTLDAVPGAVGVGLDLSVPAARRAARQHLRLAAVVADVWQPLPVGDGVIDAVVVVFAPRVVAEVARVLRPGGVLVVAGPGGDHLAELSRTLGLLGHAADKDERLDDLGHGFVLGAQRRVRAAMALDVEASCDVVLMGPNAWHLDHAAVRAWAAAGPAQRRVSLDVSVRTFRLAG